MTLLMFFAIVFVFLVGIYVLHRPKVTEIEHPRDDFIEVNGQKVPSKLKKVTIIGTPTDIEALLKRISRPIHNFKADPRYPLNVDVVELLILSPEEMAKRQALDNVVSLMPRGEA